jgi:predicted O-methyltransferase YrrM
MIETLKKYAEENNIPIILDEGLEFILNYIKEHNVKRILEIGTAIGYSSIRMAMTNKNIKIVTIERDNKMYEEAIKNIKLSNLGDQIEVIHDDAFNVNIDSKFDLIFVDGAKAQYIKLFEKFKFNLSSNGIIITDNLKFHGLVDSNEEIESKDLRALINKIRLYISFLKENKEFKTDFYDIGDGISVSRRC